MKKIVSIALLVLVYCFLNSCNPESLGSDNQVIYTADCCGEEGQLPSEPGDDEEDD